MNRKSFLTNIQFFDKKNYPRGFSRYGDFTIKEAQILEIYGYAFYELDVSKRKPINDEEIKFIEVCRGHRCPETDAEKIWVKYNTIIKKPKKFYSLYGTTSILEKNNLNIDD
ncbi:MAG: DUF413 domain-containing protein [Candidatus Dasytiphilus stammeri]